MSILIHTIKSQTQPLEVRVYLGRDSFKIIACTHGVERRVIGQVIFDRDSDLSSALSYSLAKADSLMEMLSTDRSVR